MHLLDVGRDARGVRGALDQGRLDPGSLDAVLDLVDEDVGKTVLVQRFGEEEDNEVTIKTPLSEGRTTEATRVRIVQALDGEFTPDNLDSALFVDEDEQPVQESAVGTLETLILEERA